MILIIADEKVVCNRFAVFILKISRHCVVELFCQRVGAELSTVRLAVFDCVFEGWFGLSYSSMSLFRQLLYTFTCLLSAEIADTRAVPNIPPFRWIRRDVVGIFLKFQLRAYGPSTPIDGIWQCCFYRCCFLR